MHTRFRSLAAALPALAALAFLALPAYATQMLRIVPANKAELKRIQAAIPEARDEGAFYQDGAIQFPADDGRAAALTAQGFKVEVAIPDLEHFYAGRLDHTRDYGGYHYYTTAIQAMDALQIAHPNIMSMKQSIGTTIEGRPIYVYKISSSPNANNGKPEAFFNAYIHAREAITFEVVYDMAQYLVNGYGTDPRATNIVNNRQIWIEPVVNPDGVEYNHQTNPNGGGMWRKNRRHNSDGTIGVDLNRNFSYEWGYDNIGSSPYGYDETYRGTAPFSEPESQAMRDFVDAHHFTDAVNNHSNAGLQLYAWGYHDILSPDYDGLLALGYVRQATSGYSAGNPWELLYSVNGECTDWMYGEQTAKPKIYAFVTETGGDSFWPPSGQIPALVALNRESNLRFCELADDPMRVLPPGVAVAAAPDTVPTTFTLQWSVPHPDPSNPATAYNLIEATGGTVGQDNVEGANQNRWTANGWTVSATRSHSSSHSWFSGNSDALNNTLVSRRAHKVLPGEQLKFWTWYNIESGYDYGFVEVATDARHYVSLPGSITTNNDPNSQNPGNGITGSSSNQWVQATFSLASYVGQTIWIRFHYVTDAGTSNGGWYVDDIEPSDLFTNETTVATNIPAPQYTFTSHAEGTFSYLVQSVDADGDVAAWGPPETLVVHGSPAGVPDAAAAGWRGLVVNGNPFRASATLTYDIPAASRPGDAVRLSVHDVNGREIAVLRTGSVGGGFDAGATLTERWTPTDLPAGIYFARLTVGARVSEKQIVHVK